MGQVARTLGLADGKMGRVLICRSGCEEE